MAITAFVGLFLFIGLTLCACKVCERRMEEEEERLKKSGPRKMPDLSGLGPQYSKKNR